jgi:hypothetical protein
MLERLMRNIPLGAMGQPLDIANGCLFLIYGMMFHFDNFSTAAWGLLRATFRPEPSPAQPSPAQHNIKCKLRS